MKKWMIGLIALLLLLSLSVSASAAEGKVTYSGNAGSFVFEPGSDHSPTDLFPDFKGVMPGDTLTQAITVKNDADDKVKVKIYLRSLGAHDNSVEFLSQLTLKVAVSNENEMAYLFDAAAHQPAQLSDWVCLGTLYSGGTVDLNVSLHVPVEMDNEFQNQIGYLDWEFKVEEYPVEDSDPKPPPTADVTASGWFFAAISSLTVVLLLLVRRKRNDQRI
ncbi:MAG: hypothetical protein J6B54_01010 [Clostridia bacterium]|nr:hypothetical protein [Clostridia bacterium]